MKRSRSRDQDLFQTLVGIAQRLGMRIVNEDLSKDEVVANSGFCRYKGETLVLLDQNSEINENIAVLLKALGSLDLENEYLPPTVRELLELESGKKEKGE